MYRNLLLVSIGSVIAGISRYLLQTFVPRHYPSPIPLGTLLVNISGCFFIGIVYGLAEKGNLLTPQMRLFLATGICGGYTTFSSFAIEDVLLLRDAEWFYFLLYLILTIVIGIIAAYFGSFLIRSI